MPTTFSKMAERVADAAEDMRDAHEDATEDGIDDLQNSVRRNLIGEDSVARAQLLRDIRTAKTTIDHPRAFGSHAVHLPDWAKYVEHGTGTRGAGDTLRGSIPYPAPSGLPPYDAILTWVIAKNVQPTAYDSQYALAEAIQRTIGEQGTYPHPFIRPAWRGPRGKRNIIARNRAALRDVKRDI
jgi:hypothetical protein